VPKSPIAVPYDPEWPRQFAAEAALLEPVLAPWLDGGIHHIGSTSVPGLTAKPVIDMVAGVSDLVAARAAFEPLAALGYRHQQHRPEAHSFVKGIDGPDQRGHTHHLHLTEPGSDLWRERLAFRDALRVDPALVAEYAQWKSEHYDRDRSQWRRDGSNGKRPFVQRVLAAQGIEVKPDEERLAPGVREQRRQL
jgi:GrpB-like predicted nucleotidyltransferase (UPF0157 family)